MSANHSVVLSLDGDLTIYRASEIRDLLMAHIGKSDVDCDLTMVSDMDSSGLQLLYMALQESSQAGFSFRISGHSAVVHDFVHLFRLQDTLLQPVAIRDDAKKGIDLQDASPALTEVEVING